MRPRPPLTYLKGSLRRRYIQCLISLGARCRSLPSAPAAYVTSWTVREAGPAYVLVNGLTQYAELWGAYRDALVARGFRVATFDLLGQGASDKPALFISQDDQVAALALLIDQLGDGPIFLGGISFGGLIALAICD